jgi:hypothetical protein
MPGHRKRIRGGREDRKRVSNSNGCDTGDRLTVEP